MLQWSRAKPGNPASIYIIQFLHAGRISLTPPPSAPLNATKIAVKKVCDVDVCMFGPEL